jgi:hypothetical protein
MPSQQNQPLTVDWQYESYESRKEQAKTLIGFSLTYLHGYLTPRHQHVFSITLDDVQVERVSGGNGQEPFYLRGKGYRIRLWAERGEEMLTGGFMLARELIPAAVSFHHFLPPIETQRQLDILSRLFAAMAN